jgi:hypothetical protein
MSNMEFHQSELATAESTAVMVAVLRERAEVLGREMRELKDTQRRDMEEVRTSQKELAAKLDAVLTVMSEARGGWRSVVLMGGVSATLAGGIAWILEHLVKRGG